MSSWLLWVSLCPAVCSQTLIKEKEFRTFVQLRPFEDFHKALDEARAGFKEGKVVLTM